MASLAELQGYRSALEAARYAGTLRVRHEDRWIEYRSDAELRTALADLDRQIAALSGPAPVKTVRFSTSKGFDT